MTAFVSTVDPVVAFAQTAVPAVVPAKTVFIQLAEARIRKEPLHWAAGVVTVSYGDALEVLEELPGWMKVRTLQGAEGYLATGATTVKKVLLKSNSGPIKVRADESDIVLAGKGFSKDLETSLAATDAAMNFSAVDTMEGIRVEDQKLASFVSSGLLEGGLR